MSTFIDIFFLDTCIFNKTVSAGIIAHSLEDAQQIFRTKIKYPYDNLDPEIKEWCTAKTDSARELSFNNGSSIRVGTSMRSGTLNYLHISEFGKICAKYPEKANEIVSGSLNTVQSGNFIFIESTAEGRGGFFYDYVREAQKLQDSGAEYTPLDFKLHFYPWWKHPDYQLEDSKFVINDELEEYFRKIELEIGIELNNEQKVWYAKKKIQQGEFIFREYPATIDEAFLVSNEGYFYGSQFAAIHRSNRICNIPHDPATSVDTFWDLGISDETVIWFVQRCGKEIHVIDYYENTDESLAHYVGVLMKKRDEGYIYGKHWLPHDVQVRELATGTSRYATLKKLGISPSIVGQKTANGKHTPFPKEDQIEATRNVLTKCWFDEKKCSKGIRSLENYKREWNDKHACYSNRPLHNWASHAADAFAGVGIFFNKIGKSESMSPEEADKLWQRYSLGV